MKASEKDVIAVNTLNALVKIQHLIEYFEIEEDDLLAAGLDKVNDFIAASTQEFGEQISDLKRTIRDGFDDDHELGDDDDEEDEKGTVGVEVENDD